MTTWLPVVGYEGYYEVSDDGQVKSLTRTVVYSDGRKMVVREKLLSRSITRGYPIVMLCRDGRPRSFTVHVLMATAFLGQRPFPGAEVRHKDDVKAHNTLDNLKWGTRAQNARDRWRNARAKKDYTHHSSKLTREDIGAIEALVSRTSIPQNDIAVMFKVAPSTISRIVSEYETRLREPVGKHA